MASDHGRSRSPAHFDILTKPVLRARAAGQGFGTCAVWQVRRSRKDGAVERQDGAARRSRAAWVRAALNENRSLCPARRSQKRGRMESAVYALSMRCIPRPTAGRLLRHACASLAARLASEANVFSTDMRHCGGAEREAEAEARAAAARQDQGDTGGFAVGALAAMWSHSVEETALYCRL